MLPRENVDDATAQCHLSASCNLGISLVTALQKGFDQRVAIDTIAILQHDRLLPESIGGRHPVFERSCCDNDNGAFFLGELSQNFKTLGNNLRIGNGALNGRHFQLRKEQCRDLPIQQSVENILLSSHVGADNPARSGGVMLCYASGDKGLRPLAYVLEIYATFP